MSRVYRGPDRPATPEEAGCDSWAAYLNLLLEDAIGSASWERYAEEEDRILAAVSPEERASLGGPRTALGLRAEAQSGASRPRAPEPVSAALAGLPGETLSSAPEGGRSLSVPSREVEVFEAVRILGARLLGTDLASARVRAEIENGPGVSWAVSVRIRGEAGDASARSGLALSSPADPSSLRLSLASDAGALELAGFSLALPRRPGWERVAPAPFSPSHSRVSASASAAALAIAESLARAVELRAERALRELRSRGEDFGDRDLASALGAFLFSP